MHFRWVLGSNQPLFACISLFQVPIFWVLSQTLQVDFVGTQYDERIQGLNRSHEEQSQIEALEADLQPEMVSAMEVKEWNEKVFGEEEGGGHSHGIGNSDDESNHRHVVVSQVHGGSSGIGTFAIQIAKFIGAGPASISLLFKHCFSCIESCFSNKLLLLNDSLEYNQSFSKVSGHHTLRQNVENLNSNGQVFIIRTMGGATTELNSLVYFQNASQYKAHRLLETSEHIGKILL